MEWTGTELWSHDIVVFCKSVYSFLHMLLSWVCIAYKHTSCWLNLTPVATVHPACILASACLSCQVCYPFYMIRSPVFDIWAENISAPELLRQTNVFVFFFVLYEKAGSFVISCQFCTCNPRCGESWIEFHCNSSSYATSWAAWFTAHKHLISGENHLFSSFSSKLAFGFLALSSLLSGKQTQETHDPKQDGSAEASCSCTAGSTQSHVVLPVFDSRWKSVSGLKALADGGFKNMW